MSKLQKVTRPPLDELARTLNSFDSRHRVDHVFCDWVEMCALAISNSVDIRQYDEREARYMTIVGKYSKEEARKMAEMMALLSLAMQDFDEPPLQAIMSRLELGSASAMKHWGQFFSPFHLCLMMAKMNLCSGEDIRKVMGRKGFITVMEPCCGAGGMVLAAAKVLKDEGINFQKHLHVSAVDIDPHCVHMTYVHLSLLGIPAIVYRGNALSTKMEEHWYTPMHVMDGWNAKRASADAMELLDQVSGLVDQVSDQHELPERIAQEPVAEAPIAIMAPDPIPPDPALPEIPIQRPGIMQWKIIADDAVSSLP